MLGLPNLALLYVDALDEKFEAGLVLFTRDLVWRCRAYPVRSLDRLEIQVSIPP